MGWETVQGHHVAPRYCPWRADDCGQGRQTGVEQTQGVIFSADKTTDIGNETGTTVSPEYTAHTSTFTGTINSVRIDLGEDAKDADRYIDPDELLRVANNDRNR